MADFKINVKGKSMAPLLMPSSLATVKECGISEIRYGDIAVFKSDGVFICHRVIAKSICQGKTFLKTKADIFYTPDPLVPDNSVVGKITAIQYGNFRFPVDSCAGRMLGTLMGGLTPILALLFLKIKGLAGWLRQ
jgi:signal peptidase I